jgi:hypothetical protein
MFKKKQPIDLTKMDQAQPANPGQAPSYRAPVSNTNQAPSQPYQAQHAYYSQNQYNPYQQPAQAPRPNYQQPPVSPVPAAPRTIVSASYPPESQARRKSPDYLLRQEKIKRGFALGIRLFLLAAALALLGYLIWEIAMVIGK